MDLNRLMRLSHGGKQRTGMRRNRRSLSESRELSWNVMVRNEIEFVAVPQIHRAKIRPTDPCGILEHLLKHRLQLARRRADDLKNFRGRCLPLQRLLGLI